MIDTKILVSILEQHKLTDEQAEALQNVIYKLDDGRLVELTETKQMPGDAKRGKWIDRKYKIECSCCESQVYLGTDDKGLHEEEKNLFKYCPRCGAKMDLEVEE